MSSVIQNLLNETLGDGARSTKFECVINFKNNQLFPKSSDIQYLVKTSQFPGKSHDVIDLKFKGRTIPIKGQVKYDNTWTCTFYLTQDHELKKAFEDWLESLDQVHNMNEPSDNIKASQEINKNSGYIMDMQILQMDFHGSQNTAIYNLFNVFPKSISSVDIDYSAVGTILEFTVEFSYSHYDLVVQDVNIGSSANDIKSKLEKKLDEITGEIKTELKGLFNKALTSVNKKIPNVISSSGSSNKPFSEDDMLKD